MKVTLEKIFFLVLWKGFGLGGTLKIPQIPAPAQGFGSGRANPGGCDTGGSGQLQAADPGYKEIQEKEARGVA